MALSVEKNNRSGTVTIYDTETGKTVAIIIDPSYEKEILAALKLIKSLRGK